MFTTYAVEIGDALWSAIYNHIEKEYPYGDLSYCSMYRIDGVFEEEGQKFVILQNREDMKYYRLDFSLTDAEGFSASETLIEVTKAYTPAAEPQFAQADVEAFEAEYAKKNKDKKDEEDNQESEESSEGEKEAQEEAEEEKCPECGKPVGECTCEEDKKKKKEYSLEEIPEYCELQTKYSQLEETYNALMAEKEELEAKLAPLTEFKATAEKKEKEAMINSFYMLSDEDKADVVQNIDTYSLEDIEAKLSIICVRNKVNFNLDEEDKGQQTGPTTFNLDNGSDDSTPAWVKRAMSVAKTMK